MIYLLIDSNYLCRRAYYTTGGLSYKGQPTGVIYGFLAEIQNLWHLYDSWNFLFFFDSRSSLRKEIRPEYKQSKSRKNMKDTEGESTYQEEVETIRTIVLPEIGFEAIYMEEGFESDDLIASFVKYPIIQNRRTGTAVIVSSDQDLWQLLTDKVIMYDPRTRRRTTAKSLAMSCGVNPYQWSLVKAIAGCSTDNVKGLKGVGELTAIRHINQVKLCKAIEEDIEKGQYGVISQNLVLVDLPYPGTPLIPHRDNNVTRVSWNKVCKKYGMKTLRIPKPPTHAELG